jgi:prenyltransferase beta subunit
LKRLTALSLLMFLSAAAAADEVVVDADSVQRYVEACRKENGAFGPMDQEYTDAAWNFPAVATLRLMGAEIARPDAILKHGTGSPGGHAGRGHWTFFHHHRLRALLGDPLRAKRKVVSIAFAEPPREVGYYASPFGTEADLYFKAGNRPYDDPLDVEAERLVYHDLTSLHHALSGLRDSGRRPAETETAVEFIRRHQAADGGFASGSEHPSAGHVLTTFFAVESLHWLGAPVPNREKAVAFLHSCRHASGGYRSHERGESDIAFTWAALGAFRLLDAAPQEPGKTVEWINSLQNADGGFGDRPGWRSRHYSTWFAVESLSHLGGPVRDRIAAKTLVRPEVKAIPAGEFGIFQAIFKVPVVAPADLEGLSKRGIHLLGLKSIDFTVAEPLSAEIRSKKLPMDVVLCPEMYPHRLLQFDGKTLNHVGNFTLDPRWGEPERAAWRTADALGASGAADWPAYAAGVIGTVRKLGGLAYPEQDFEMEYAYGSYDGGTGMGYDAVLAGFNWAPRDFVRVFPWRERDTARLIPVADVDAHGDLKKWSKHLDATRTLFFAKGPTFADFREAAAAGRVVTVIAEPEGVASGASYYGPPAAVAYARARRAEWQWWDGAR